ncbi:hypothetical protein F4861DRAFT_132270 [Xylaria intraflava]|nr:hypothetical protein F4861DRAFT_132270 [Xylaria intraflava]
MDQHLNHPLPSLSSRNSSPVISNSEPNGNTMAKPAPSSSARVGKRKAIRSVSTLTPSQLARKRANDREAQRAIRARTKEHIENLEREIDELRSQQSRDQTVQDLLGRNRALEDEVRRLRDSLGIRTAGPGMPGYPNCTSNSYNGSSSQPSPYGHSTPDYPMVSDMPTYSNVSDTTSVWPSSVPCSLPSTGSSPSSPAALEEYGNNYFPSNASSSILERSSMPPAISSPVAPCLNGDLSFEGVKSVAYRVWMPTTDRHRSHFSNVSSTTGVERVPRVLPSVSSNNLARPLVPSYGVQTPSSKPSRQDGALFWLYR